MSERERPNYVEIAQAIEKREELEKEQLRQLLVAYDIPLDVWGKGDARTFEDLYKEISNGESVLIPCKDGRLVRQYKIAAVDVYHTDERGQKFRLVEEKQVFKDKEERERYRDAGAAVHEKFKPDERDLRAALRGLVEELEIKGKISIDPKDVVEQNELSMSYPGLVSEREVHHYEVDLSRDQYRSQYIEDQPDKTTYFGWKKVRRKKN